MLCSLAARCGSRLFSSLVSSLISHLISHLDMDLFLSSHRVNPRVLHLRLHSRISHMPAGYDRPPHIAYRLCSSPPQLAIASHRTAIASKKKELTSFRLPQLAKQHPPPPPRANSSHASISSSYPILGCKLFRLYFSSSIYDHDGYVRSSVMCSVKLPQSSSSVLLSES